MRKTRLPRRVARSVLSVVLLAMAMAGCGGGGGGSPATPSGQVGDPPPPPSGGGSGPAAGWTVSGALLVDESAAVDSDTNDPEQTSRADNGEFETAQMLDVPVMVAGSVNDAYAGPSKGYNYVSGDVIDGFKVHLKRGQVVELAFAADPGDTDLELYAFNESEQQVGASTDTSQYECLQAGEDGVYYLAVGVYQGASVYNLRIINPTGGASCANVITQDEAIVPNELVALAKPQKTRVATAQSVRLKEAGVTFRHDRAGVPNLLKLPASAGARQGVFAKLSGASVSQRVVPRSRLRSAVDNFVLAKQLRASGQYVYAEVNRWAKPLAVGVGDFPPNDPFYAKQQWHYEQINLPAAMARLQSMTGLNNERPVVAVVDSGIISDHPDLRPNLVGGYSFVSLVNLGDGNTPNPEDPSRPEHEPHFHGSHVAGTIGASTFDGVGAAGVAPMAKLLPVRVFDPSRKGASSYDIVQGVLYAAGLPNGAGVVPAKHADVINLSLGGNGACPAYYQDAFNQVRAQGVLVIAAAGNDARNDLGQPLAVGNPANCDGVVSVGALGTSRRQASFSQSGAKLKVSAPGGDLVFDDAGRLIRMDEVFSTVAGFDGLVRVPTIGGMPGTSMASPHVAGVAALMKYVYPQMTPDQFETWLAQGKLTDDLGGPGRDDVYGYGLINARKAVDVAAEAAGTPGQAPEGQIVANPASLDFGATRTTMDIQLLATADTQDVVRSIVSASPDVVVTRRAVNESTGLGSYTVVIDRSKWPPGTQVLALTVTTDKRSFTIYVSAIKVVDNGGVRIGNLGQMYVLLVDPRDRSVLASQSVSPSGGRYGWSFAGIKVQAVQIVAGADLDNDGYICGNAEPCGAYPILGSQLVEVPLTADRSGLDFVVSPLGGASVSALGAVAPRSLAFKPVGFKR